ncbi:MAG: hypothetical protein ACE5ED_06895 [Rhodothalassiaceae bacterium]
MASAGRWGRVFRRFTLHREEPPRVGIGDRFFEYGNWDSVWIVERILEPRGVGIPHAVISHASLRSERRLVALSTLCDSARFSRDARSAGRGTPTGPRRRRHDPPRDARKSEAGKPGTV